jgi:proteasome lid subunit RPN8/RPN11
MAVELHLQVSRGGERIASEPAALGPCTEDALFRGVVSGRLANDGRAPDYEVEPRFRDPGRGTVDSFLLREGPMPAGRYDSAVFRPQIHALLAELRSAEHAGDPASLEWQLVARRAPAPAAPRPRVRRAPYPLEDGALGSVPSGSFEVEIEPGVLERIGTRVLASYPLECAGLLLGRLIRDTRRRCALLRIDGSVEVEAGAGGRSGSHFAFAPETFLAAAAQDRVCGWVHSHPPCAGCPENADCRADTIWFSSDDVSVHGAAFPGAWMVGLVGGKAGRMSADRPAFRLYGWSHGQITERVLRVAN